LNANLADDMSIQMASDRLWEKCRRMIFIPRNAATKGYVVGHWPIPEDYWVNINTPTLVCIFDFLTFYVLN